MKTKDKMIGTGIGIWFSGSSGRYRDNLAAGVPAPYVGGTDAGNNN